MDINIALLPGDGIGPEIVTEALKVLEKVGQKFGHEFVFTHLLMGGAAWAIYGLASRVLDGAFLALAQQMFADPDKIQLWSVYLANAACVLLGILAGVIVYGVLVIALRILRAEDVRSIPRGEKLIKLLHLK